MNSGSDNYLEFLKLSCYSKYLNLLGDFNNCDGTVKNIDNENDYTAIMARIDSLMAKGSENVSKEELAEIRALALAAQRYERQKFS